MITVQEATDAAKKYLTESFPEFAESGLRLEEIESPLKGGLWTFTFSAAIPGESGGNSLLDALRPRRWQKLVQVESDSGILVAVKNKAA